MQYKIIRISKLGNKDPQYGQRYWGEAEGMDYPVSFNTHLDLDDGVTIEAEEKIEKETQKGKTYFLLRKISLSEPASDGDILKRLDDIEKSLKLILEKLSIDEVFDVFDDTEG